jgi:hypothetical protein
MSNTTPLMLGLAGGLVLWHFAPSAPPTLRNASGGPYVIQLDSSGLSIDGELVDTDEAVRRAELAGIALVTVAPDASASVYAALRTGLQRAGVPAHARTLVASTRNATTETFSAFTLVTYPEGIGGSRKTSWFRAEAPMTWRAARDQLVAAGVIDPSAIAPKQAGYWKLVTDARVFMPMRAKPLPGTARSSYISTTFTLVVYPEGVGGPKTTRWFTASRPTMWDAARDRLAAAGILDLNADKATDPNYWILTSSPNAFREDKAEPLPAAKRTRDASRTGRYALDGGRVVARDGQPLVRLERVDLGDDRYALSPYETDEMAAKIVRLLNRRGAR